MKNRLNVWIKEEKLLGQNSLDSEREMANEGQSSSYTRP